MSKSATYIVYDEEQRKALPFADAMGYQIMQVNSGGKTKIVVTKPYNARRRRTRVANPQQLGERDTK